MQTTETAMLAERLSAMAEAFGAKPPTAAAVEVWFETLQEFSFFDVSGLLIGWPKRASKMPAPADIWKILNEQRTDKIESEAENQKRREKSEIAQGFRHSPELAAKLKSLVSDMKAQDRMQRDPKDWARKIIECYCERGIWPGTNKPLNYTQYTYARQALGISMERLDEMRQERDNRKAGIAPAFSDDWGERPEIEDETGIPAREGTW